MIDPEVSEQLHDQLLADRGRIQGEIDGLNRSGIRGDVFQADESDSVDQHPADAGSELYEREKNLTVRGTLEITLQQIDDALKKFESGTYGICDNCGKPIPEARLRAMPSAAYDVECQARMERQAHASVT